MVEAIESELKRCNTNKLVLLRERRFFFSFFFFADKRVDTNTYSHLVTCSHKQWWNNAVAKVHRTESKFFFLYPDSLIHFTYAYALPYRSNSLTHFCVAFFRFSFLFKEIHSFVFYIVFSFFSSWNDIHWTNLIYCPSVSIENRNEIKSAHTKHVLILQKTKKKQKQK